MAEPLPIAIIGAGITGLACAYHLTLAYPRKYAITIIARDLPGDLSSTWASPWAGAIFQPVPTTMLMKQEMQITSFNFYQKLIQDKPSSETGVQKYPVTEYFDSVSETSTSPDPLNKWYQQFIPDFRVIPLEELPQSTGVTSGVKYTSLAVNPNIFLPYLQNELEKVGTRFIRAEVRDVAHARNLSSSTPKLVINATGLGAKVIANDEAVIPVRGQTMFIKTDYAESLLRGGSGYTYIIPRAHSGGVIIGGVAQPGRTDTTVDEHMREVILRKVNALSDGVFKDLDLVEGRKRGDVVDVVGFRPARKEGLRIELDEAQGVVHAYGVGGAGYIYSFGVAERVGGLIDNHLTPFESKVQRENVAIKPMLITITTELLVFIAIATIGTILWQYIIIYHLLRYCHSV